MFYHNTNVSLRNLTKYKLQTTISILSMAIGLVVLAAVHSALELHVRPDSLTTTPYYDRVCHVQLLPIEEPEEGGKTLDISSDALRALNNGGEFHTLEMGPTFQNHIYMSGGTQFTLNDTLTRKLNVEVKAIEASYARFSGYRSTLTGKPIGKLRPGSVILPRAVAKAIFGGRNPVGARVKTGIFAGDIPYEVVDIYDKTSGPLMYVPETETMMDYLSGRFFIVHSFDVVLKEDCTPEEAAQEMNIRLAPTGCKAKLTLHTERFKETRNLVPTMRTVGYLFGSLILLAACIGYLRMQLQLFWMRKREMTLRMVNGAKRRDLFVLLMTEVGIVLASVTVLAMVFGLWLEEFVNLLAYNMTEGDPVLAMESLPAYCAVFAVVLFALHGLIVWVTLNRICNHALGLAAGMRPSRNHTFRNVMLGLQVCIGMLFVSAALVLVFLCNAFVNEFVLPEDETPYRNCIYIDSYQAENRARLDEELSRLPGVAQTIPFDHSFQAYAETANHDSLVQRKQNCFHSYYVKDTALLDFFRVQTKWMKPELKGRACVLIHEEIYPLLDRLGILANGVLTNCWGTALPVAGTFKDVVFSQRQEGNRINIIMINPHLEKKFSTYLLVPEEGSYDMLWMLVERTIARLEPNVASQMAFNFYEKQAPAVRMVKYLRMAAWILGSLALLICLMGIYSTIALDTRARRKEVAIRKINGAKTGDIASLFTRVYVVLVVIALLLILPLAAILQVWVRSHGDESLPPLPILWLSIVGCLIVTLSIALIVGWHVRRVMRVNPAEMIAKE